MIPVEVNNPVRRTIVVTHFLILINVVLHLAFTLRSLGVELIPSFVPTLDQAVQLFGAKPAEISLATMLTSMFVHAGIMHLLGNMYLLKLFGDNVEDLLGPIGFLFAYVVCGFAGDAIDAIVRPSSTIPSVGASGAISGIMAIYVMFFPHVKLKFVQILPIADYRPLRCSAFVAVMIWLVLNAVMGLRPFFYAAATPSNIGFLAHVAGAAAGFLLGAMFIAFGALDEQPELVLRGVGDDGALAPEADSIIPDALEKYAMPLTIKTQIGNAVRQNLWEAAVGMGRCMLDAFRYAGKRTSIPGKIASLLTALLLWSIVLGWFALGTCWYLNPVKTERYMYSTRYRFQTFFQQISGPQ